jgi:hypothetical protein
MDLRRRQWFLSAILLSAALLIDPQFSTAATASENLVFEVRSKFAGKRVKDLGALRAHDVHRHSRLLSAIDIPLGGDSQPESIGFESPFTRTCNFGNFLTKSRIFFVFFKCGI